MNDIEAISYTGNSEMPKGEKNEKMFKNRDFQNSVSFLVFDVVWSAKTMQLPSTIPYLDH